MLRPNLLLYRLCKDIPRRTVFTWGEGEGREERGREEESREGGGEGRITQDVPQRATASARTT